MRNKSRTFVGAKELSEIAGVDFVKVVHRDKTESKYYIK
jgi:hypothetical protein